VLALGVELLAEGQLVLLEEALRVLRVPLVLECQPEDGGGEERNLSTSLRIEEEEITEEHLLSEPWV
jgi:hypothetical protein